MMQAALLNHLLQSTLFAGAAWLLTLAFRKNRARVRYALWLAASVKFLIPFSILITVGGLFAWRTTAGVAQSGMSLAMVQVGQALAAPIAMQPSPLRLVPIILWSVWGIGFAVVVFSWLRRWRALRAALQSATRVDLTFGIEVMTSPEFPEPGVYGIRRPILLLPAGIMSQVTPQQLEAILAHELCHVRRRDNLATAVHMAVEAIFWFHPLVWWIGARLMEERERACDEEVLRLGSSPQVYAEGILKICELYLESPLPCVAGVTGANLKHRIEAIMANRVARRLSVAGKILLATAGVATVSLPVVIGMMTARVVLAQPPVAAPVVTQTVQTSPPPPVAAPVAQPLRLEASTSYSAVATGEHDALVLHGTLPGGLMTPPPGVSQDEYSRRLAYVEANFSGRPSPRGRTYLRYGAPDQIEDGSAEPQNPSQIWRYNYLPDFASRVEFQLPEKGGSRVNWPPPLAIFKSVPGADATLAEVLSREAQHRGELAVTPAVAGLPGGQSEFQTYPAGAFQVLSVPLGSLSGEVDILAQVRMDGRVVGVLRDGKQASSDTYQAGFTLEAGAYVCGVVVREKATGRMFGETIRFEVK